MMKRRRDQEDGMVLVLALVFVTFMGVLALGVLNYATTNSLATSRLRPVRAVQAAADGATEGAINKLRQFRPAERNTAGQWVSTAPCPTNFYTYTPVPGSEYTVDCSNSQVTAPVGTTPASRTVTFTACPVLAMSDGATTSGSNRLTSATAAFTTRDLGRVITGNGIPTGTRIATYVNSSTVTMSATATATGSGLAISTTCSSGSALVVARVQFAGTPPNVSATVKSWSVNR